MTNGIDLILADHRRVEDLFARFEQTSDPTLVGQIVDALTAHDDAEHSALYPFAGVLLGDAALVERLAVAHSLVKQQLDHLRAREGAEFVSAVQMLRALVADHVADEERDLLPAITEAASPAQLEVLASRILATKQRVG